MFQGGGNIPLIMPIVGALAARGHDVRIMAGPGIRGRPQPVTTDFLERIERSGAQIVPFVQPETDPFEAAPPLRGVAFGWTPKRFELLSSRTVRITLWSKPWASNVSDELQRAPTDALVSDFFLFGAIAAGEAARVPTAVIVHNAFPPRARGHPPKGSGFSPARNPLDALGQFPYRWITDRIWARDGLPAHNEARRVLGLERLASSPFEECDRAARVLILGYESFDFPATRLQANVRYVGTPIDDAAVASDTWTSPWPADDAPPMVLVSMSTLPQGQGPTMHRIIEALSEMPVRALVTLGPSLRQEDFRAPPNVALETFVPHSAVLPHAYAIISQCGLSTLAKALRHGVPLLCMPLLGDQPDNAARIVAGGAGLRLPPTATPTQIRGALAQLLDEPSFRDAARRLGAEMSGERAEERAADELEAIAR